MPQTVFVPSAVCQSDVSWFIVFQKICVPRPSRKPGVISASRMR